MIRIIVFTLLFVGCSDGIQETLDEASGNKANLLRVLMHYKMVDRTPYKYEAAYFLIENMKYHHSVGKLKQKNDTLDRLVHETDSIYYSISKGRSVKEHNNKAYTDSLFKLMRARKDSLYKRQMPKAIVDNDPFIDCSKLSFRFCI